MASLRPASTRFCSSRLRLSTPIAMSRSFTTSSTRRKGNLPNFHPTSSPELDELLSTFRTNIFFPAQLSLDQRKLVYRKKYHHLLTGDEPATATIGSEVIRMVPLDHSRDEPNTDSSIARVLNLMGEAGDDAWQNLPEFLIGLKSSKRKLKGHQIEKIVRKACRAKKEGLVKQCCMRVEDTGLGLWELGAVKELMWAALRRAYEGGWEKDGLRRGLKFAEDLWLLMQDPRHHGRSKGTLSVWPRRRPEVVGVLVQLQAATTASLGEGENRGEKLKEYVKILLATWKNAELELPRDWNDANQKLMMWTPVWHGMKTARQLLGDDKEMRNILGVKLVQEVEPVLQRARDLVLTSPPQEGARRGAKLYDALSNFSQ